MRYFFDIHDGTDHRDAEGMEFSGLEAARAQAMQVAAAYVGQPPLEGDCRGYVRGIPEAGRSRYGRMFLQPPPLDAARRACENRELKVP